MSPNPRERQVIVSFWPCDVIEGAIEFLVHYLIRRTLGIITLIPCECPVISQQLSESDSYVRESLKVVGVQFQAADQPVLIPNSVERSEQNEQCILRTLIGQEPPYRWGRTEVRVGCILEIS